jgi:RimJ/RimL family protein N-acetyltransferase
VQRIRGHGDRAVRHEHAPNTRHNAGDGAEAGGELAAARWCSLIHSGLLASKRRMTIQPIRTERLVLRPPKATDAVALFQLASSVAVTKYVGWQRHTTLEDTASFLAFSESEWERWPAGPLLIESRADGTLLGTCGLSFETPYRASTGYVLAQSAWGRGFATEALRANAELADRLGLRRLFALCHVEHLASARVLERVGFEREGILRKFLVFPNLNLDAPQDVFCYSRTR